MKISKIQIQNFRLLENASISLDPITLVVGRNNSGKTSLIDVFYKFLSGESMRFKFEDFSINTHIKFRRSLELWRELKKIKSNGAEEEIEAKELELRNSIPFISVTLFIEYNETDNLASLAPFIMDLDPNRKDACIVFEYSPDNSEKIFHEYDKAENIDFIAFLKKNFIYFYREKIFAIDSFHPANRRIIEKKSIVSNLFLSSFIYAQRHLDDQTLNSSKKLSQGFESYYNDHHKNDEITQKLQSVLNTTSKDWDELYEEIFKLLLNDLKTFGYPGLNSHELAIKSEFDAAKVLKGNTNVYYQHSQDNLLPEAYNGLGFKNLIYIILQFITFHEKYKKQEPHPSFHIIFIEEPEAHLHPQMQCTFIKNIQEFVKNKTGWSVQIVITSHSSHIVSASSFDSIRYFDSRQGSVAVRNLKDFNPSEPDTIKFLTQYMSLNNCDMFFADKIVMIEGTVERILLPAMLKKIDEKSNVSLFIQYLSIIEVGGAYAHKFKELLDFLGVRTLIITDIDTINSNNERKKCRVSEGDKTSNQVLKQWIPAKESKTDLLNCQDADKIKGNVRIAYQIPENESSYCSRSFEEAFIFCNASLLSTAITLVSSKSVFKDKNQQTIKDSAYDLADKLKSKTDFAFDLMLLDGWQIPKYIEDGLLWLEKQE